MIVIRPFEGERIPVKESERKVINQIFDNSAAKWTQPNYVAQLFSAANSRSNTWVYLRSEGWHQKDDADGVIYKHVTVHYNGWTYHCYTTVEDISEEPTGDKHTIDCISYQTGKNQSHYLYPA